MGAGPDLPVETGIPTSAQVDAKGPYPEAVSRTYRGDVRKDKNERRVEGAIRHNPNKETE